MWFRRLAAPAVLAAAIDLVAGPAHAWTDARVSAVETTVHLDTVSKVGDDAQSGEATVLAGIVLDVAVLGGQLRALDVSGFAIAAHDEAKHPSIVILERKDESPFEDKLHATLARAGRVRRRAAAASQSTEAARYELIFGDALERGLYRIAFTARVRLQRRADTTEGFELEIPPFALGLERVRVHFTSATARGGSGWRVSEAEKPAEGRAASHQSTFERVVMPRLTPWTFAIENPDAQTTLPQTEETLPSTGSTAGAPNARRIGSAVFLFSFVIAVGVFALDSRRRLVRMPSLFRAALVLFSFLAFTYGYATSVTLAALASTALFVSLGSDTRARARSRVARTLLGAALLGSVAVAVALSLSPGGTVDEAFRLAISPLGFVAPWLATLLSPAPLRVESGLADA